MAEGDKSPEVINLTRVSGTQPLKDGEYRVLDEAGEKRPHEAILPINKKVSELLQRADAATAKAGKKIAALEQKTSSLRSTEPDRDDEIERELQKLKAKGK